MVTYLVLVCCAHILHNLLTLGLGNTTALGNNLSENSIDLTSHVRGIATDIEKGLLLEELGNLLRMLLETVLNVNLLLANS